MSSASPTTSLEVANPTISKYFINKMIEVANSSTELNPTE